MNKLQNGALSEKGRQKEGNRRGWRETGSSLHHESGNDKIQNHCLSASFEI